MMPAIDYGFARQSAATLVAGRPSDDSIGNLARAFLALYDEMLAPWQRLSPRQREILGFIEETVDATGCAPSFEEISRRFEFKSLATVHEHLLNLERKGWIERGYNTARAITVRRSLASRVAT